MLSKDFRADLFNWAYKWSRWEDDFPEKTFREFLHSKGFPVEEETERIFGHVLDTPNFWSEIPVKNDVKEQLRISAADLDRRDMLNVLPDAQNSPSNAPVLKSDTSTRLDNLEAMGGTVDDRLDKHDTQITDLYDCLEEDAADIKQLKKQVTELIRKVHVLEGRNQLYGAPDTDPPYRAVWNGVDSDVSKALSKIINDTLNKRAGRKV